VRSVIQVVSQASVRVDGQCVGKIAPGLLVLLAVAEGDQQRDLDYMVDKVAGLRVFPDQQGKMNCDIRQSGGEVLVVSQFTLMGDVRRGKRPSFSDAARPEIAAEMYDHFCRSLRDLGIAVQQGVFQAVMQVSLINEGPVTILLDSRRLF
jgi:D-tyrosyl-tRNA(Tyr) deacylase